MKLPIAILIFALAALPAAAAEKLSLGAISNYLNGIATAQSEFTQINDDGTISTGTVYIKRPGKMRFEYNPPDQTLVVAGNQAVAIFDKKSNVPNETYPLHRTPLSIILAPRVDLSRARMVTGHGFDGTATQVTAQDPDNPEYGNITMSFTGAPVELRQWTVNDANGGQTTVILGELKLGGSLPNRLFNTGGSSSGSDR
ncbi:outer membrane lipoprotein carrier protein LolA [Sulfitobacter sp. D35]|uniref:LolA family protein n=1 Tax=Sulfitobacter sp. D35 TaxID=3083252 RepID=UPI00296E4C99|nr:outer membrane lipoprotein carrier protein LolA [Sulfitobacter sp. D35]MDW4498352.1 outer membrane lipoprotein carrier protein LolA [Sulfitobacter sp. D35]